ncbi:hypothetical protein Elgi_68910 [Paenibacillus elgii]|nr:hypothetical protein Elgi_68910 [Paenibacillus elgii]
MLFTFAGVLDTRKGLKSLIRGRRNTPEKSDRSSIGGWKYASDARRMAILSFTPEFNPPGYMYTLPFIYQPVTDVWDVNKWMNQFFFEKNRDVFE